MNVQIDTVYLYCLFTHHTHVVFDLKFSKPFIADPLITDGERPTLIVALIVARTAVSEIQS